MIKATTTCLLISPALTLLTTFFFIPLFFMIRISFLKPPEGTGFYIPDTFTFINYVSLFDDYGISIIIKTIMFALEVSFFSMLLSFGFALLIQKLSIYWRAVSITCLLIPKIINPLIIIFGLQNLLGNNGQINQLLIILHICNEPLNLIRNHLGAFIGEIYFIFPLATLFIFIQINPIIKEVEIAAKGLGANYLQVFRKITLPLITTWQISMAWSLAAFNGPLFLGNPSDSTISCEIYHQTFELGNWPLAAAWSVLLTATVICFLYSPRLINLCLSIRLTK
jgi:ABC-type spermidine/putrescine transport system permease subunit I